MIAAVPSTHVRVDQSSVAWIDDTNVKVVEVVTDHLAYGLSPAEIHLQHPHLSLAQIHAALAYYFDHQAELDAEMEQRYGRAETLRQRTEPPFTRESLSSRLPKQ